MNVQFIRLMEQTLVILLLCNFRSLFIYLFYFYLLKQTKEAGATTNLRV
jgi:hypothetical protein